MCLFYLFIYNLISKFSLASPAMGHWGTCPLDLPTIYYFFSVNFRTAQSVRLNRQTYLYSATAAALVQSGLHEPCSVYCLASFYVRQKVSCIFVPPSSQILATPLYVFTSKNHFVVAYDRIEVDIQVFLEGKKLQRHCCG